MLIDSSECRHYELREAQFPYIDKEVVAMAGGESLGSNVNHVQRVVLSGEMGGGR